MLRNFTNLTIFGSRQHKLRIQILLRLKKNENANCAFSIKIENVELGLLEKSIMALAVFLNR